MTTPQLCLVTGATGYVGGRLVPELLAAGHRVRVMVRDERRDRGPDWADDVEVAVADATDPDAVREGAGRASTSATTCCTRSAAGKDFADTEERIAQTLRRRRGRRPASAGSSTSAGSRPRTRR